MGPGTNIKKQELRYAGPFVIKRVFSNGVIELDGLPPQVLTRLNVEYVRPYRRSKEAEDLRQRRVPPAPSGEEEPRWEVEKIMDVRWRRRRREYLVKWVGYQQPIWEPKVLLDGCTQALQAFHEELRRTRKSSRED